MRQVERGVREVPEEQHDARVRDEIEEQAMQVHVQRQPNPCAVGQDLVQVGREARRAQERAAVQPFLDLHEHAHRVEHLILPLPPRPALQHLAVLLLLGRILRPAQHCRRQDVARRGHLARTRMPPLQRLLQLIHDAVPLGLRRPRHLQELVAALLGGFGGKEQLAQRGVRRHAAHLEVQCDGASVADHIVGPAATGGHLAAFLRVPNALRSVVQSDALASAQKQALGRPLELRQRLLFAQHPSAALDQERHLRKARLVRQVHLFYSVMDHRPRRFRRRQRARLRQTRRAASALRGRSSTAQPPLALLGARTAFAASHSRSWRQKPAAEE
eukprot:scaffold388_cov244-Pinguiococcus_pyrenoidosus.AAC.38